MIHPRCYSDASGFSDGPATTPRVGSGAKELRLFDWKPGILPENCFTAFLRRYGASAIQGSNRPEANPYCVRREWDKSADPNPAQIRNYFRASAPGLFDARTLDLLAW